MLGVSVYSAVSVGLLHLCVNAGLVHIRIDTSTSMSSGFGLRADALRIKPDYFTAL